MKINKNKSFFTKDIFNHNKSSPKEELFIRVKNRKQGTSVETIAKSRMSTSLKIYKFFSDIFGIELRKISQICRSKEGQKLILKKDPDQQKHIKSNIEHINLKIGKLNKKLIFLPKVKTIPTQFIKIKIEPKKTKYQDLNLGVPETKASSVDKPPRKTKKKRKASKPIKKDPSQVNPDLKSKQKVLRPQSVDLSPPKVKSVSRTSAPPALAGMEEPKRKKTKKTKKQTKTKKKAQVKKANYSLKYLSSFYRNEGKNKNGRTLETIWSFSFKEKESAHNYIQWLFPLPEKSRFNSSGPCPSIDMFAELNKDPAIRLNMLHSFKIMLNFYGLKLKNDGTIVQTKSFKTKRKNWLTRGNHNHSRISRIIKSMRLFGYEAEAQAFYARLVKINNAYPGKINSESLKYWKQYAEA